MKEAEIQKRCILSASKTGWYSFTLTEVGNVGWPDVMFVRDGLSVLIEFKTPTGVVRQTQLRKHDRIRKSGIDVHIVRSVEEFNKLMDGYDLDKTFRKRLARCSACNLGYVPTQ